MRNISRPFNRRGIADLSLLSTIILEIHQKSHKPSFWGVINSFVLLAYASLAASRTLLQQLLACLNFTLDSEVIFCWFLWTMAAATANENHGNEWGLTWSYLQRGIYTLIPTWTHSQNSLVAAEAQSLKISFHGTSLKWWRRPS